MMLLTASRLRAARRCRRLHYNRYGLGFKALFEDEVLRFGTLMHRALEVWWLNWKLPPDERLALALAIITSENPFEAAKARVLMLGYHLRWLDEPYDVISVEVEFKCELRNPETGAASRTWQLAGKIDAIVRDRRTGLVYLIEHKTSAESLEPGSDYFKKLRLDGQVSVYFEGGRSLGHDIAGCIYDVIGKPALKPLQVATTDEAGEKVVLDEQGQRVRTKTGKWRQTADKELGYVLQARGETPEEYEARVREAVAEDPSRYFVRAEVVRLEAEMRDAMLDVWQLGQELREAELAGRQPKNPDACSVWGRTCEYFATCTGEASLEDPALFKRSTNVHPELSGPVEARPKEEAEHEHTPTAA